MIWQIYILLLLRCINYWEPFSRHGILSLTIFPNNLSLNIVFLYDFYLGSGMYKRFLYILWQPYLLWHLEREFTLFSLLLCIYGDFDWMYTSLSLLLDHLRPFHNNRIYNRRLIIFHIFILFTEYSDNPLNWLAFDWYYFNHIFTFIFLTRFAC